MKALNEVDFEAAINDCIEDMAACWNRRDVAGFCKYYAENTIVATRGPKIFQGRQELLKHYVEQLRIPGFRIIRITPHSLKFAPAKSERITKATVLLQYEAQEMLRWRLEGLSLTSFIVTEQGLRIDHEGEW